MRFTRERELARLGTCDTERTLRPSTY